MCRYLFKMDNEKIKIAAIKFARANKTSIANRITDLDRYPREQNPVSVFMAGSLGAGKTEASIQLPKWIDKWVEKKKRFDKKFNLIEDKSEVIRIDADYLRFEFEEYNGTHSDLFQAATSILVDRILDTVLKQSQSFILDGTLSNYNKAEKNISRSIERDRIVQILYVYQTPQASVEIRER